LKFFTLFFLSFLQFGHASPAGEPVSPEKISHEFITDSDSKKKIEFYWSKPEGTGPWPILVLIHPHQEWPDKIGAKAFVNWKVLDNWTQKGWITVAVSQPGYGESDGPADFCGPESQKAVLEVMNHFRQMPIVKKDSMVLYGGSRGAVLASLIATKDSHLAGVILRSGLYNMADAYKRYSWYNPIKLTMIWEIGWNKEDELKNRSPIFEADKIKAPLLILHGDHDDRAPMQYAQALADKVKGSGGQVEFISFDSEHVIPKEKIDSYMEAFLKKVVR
jgi:dipeptidyl aminopeptidase/acylaminoacyl peptidase